VHWIVLAFRLGGPDLQALPHGSKQEVESLDTGRDLIGLEPADRGLPGPDALREPLLTETSSEAGAADQVTRAHLGDYNVYVIKNNEFGA
jgi:hypothetical protein